MSSRGEYVARSPRVLGELSSGVEPLPAQVKLLCDVRGSGIEGRPFPSLILSEDLGLAPRFGLADLNPSFF